MSPGNAIAAALTAPSSAPAGSCGDAGRGAATWRAGAGRSARRGRGEPVDLAAEDGERAGEGEEGEERARGEPEGAVQVEEGAAPAAAGRSRHHGASVAQRKVG